jgi:hypothetical protein
VKRPRFAFPALLRNPIFVIRASPRRNGLSFESIDPLFFVPPRVRSSQQPFQAQTGLLDRPLEVSLTKGSGLAGLIFVARQRLARDYQKGDPLIQNAYQ